MDDNTKISEKLFDLMTEHARLKLKKTNPKIEFNKYLIDKLNEQDVNWKNWPDDDCVKCVVQIYLNIMGISDIIIWKLV